MRKNGKRFLFVLLPIFIFGCADVYDGGDGALEEEEIIPPGPDYTPEEKYNLNVYAPVDVDDKVNWHYRLSGMALHVQGFFTENMKCQKIDKKFGLELNAVNPKFVRIHYIKSEKKSLDMNEKNTGEISREVLAYFEQHPGKKASDNYLVFMPEYEGSFISHTYPTDKIGILQGVKAKLSRFSIGQVFIS